MNHCNIFAVKLRYFVAPILHRHGLDSEHVHFEAFLEKHFLLQWIGRVLVLVEAEAGVALVILKGEDEENGQIIRVHAGAFRKDQGLLQAHRRARVFWQANVIQGLPLVVFLYF